MWTCHLSPRKHQKLDVAPPCPQPGFGNPLAAAGSARLIGTERISAVGARRQMYRRLLRAVSSYSVGPRGPGFQRWRHSSKATIDVPREVLASWKPRKQQPLCPSGLCCRTTHVLTSSGGRQVIHFIDNVGALCGMHKGSLDLDSARQVHIKETRTLYTLCVRGSWDAGMVRVCAVGGQYRRPPVP